MPATLKTYALTTVARLAQFMGITPSAAQEDLLTNLINQVTAFVEKDLGYRVQKTTYTNELADGDDSGVITVKASPIIQGEALSVQFRNSQLNQDDWETINGENYTVDYKAGQILGMGGYTFRGGRGLFRVTYTAGFDFDNSTTFLSDTEGGDLEYAAWKLAQAAYNDRGEGGAVEAESIGDYSVTFSKVSNEDSQVADILGRYASLDFGAGLTPSHY